MEGQSVRTIEHLICYTGSPSSPVNLRPPDDSNLSKMGRGTCVLDIGRTDMRELVPRKYGSSIIWVFDFFADSSVSLFFYSSRTSGYFIRKSPDCHFRSPSLSIQRLFLHRMMDNHQGEREGVDGQVNVGRKYKSRKERP